MKTITQITAYLLMCLLIFVLIYTVGLGVKYTANQMRQYEIEHDCRYDYNDLCYTRDERPWLFND